MTYLDHPLEAVQTPHLGGGMERSHAVPGPGQQLPPGPGLADQVLQDLEMTLLSRQVDWGHTRLVQDSIGAKQNICRI